MNNENEPFAPPPQPPPLTETAPTRAAICALVPGIGAVYNREYTKAVVHFAVFAGLVIVAEEVGIFGLAAFSFYIFTIFDAYRSAILIGRRNEPNSGREGETMNLPVWGGILVLMGVLFLLDNLGAIHIRSAVEYWPVILILLGVYMIAGFFTRPADKKSSSHDISRM